MVTMTKKAQEFYKMTEHYAKVNADLSSIPLEAIDTRKGYLHMYFNSGAIQLMYFTDGIKEPILVKYINLEVALKFNKKHVNFEKKLHEYLESIGIDKEVPAYSLLQL